MHPSNKVTLANAGDVVRYHKPTENQAKRHELLSEATEAFIRIILVTAPDCADRSSAIRHARIAKMEASAAVALEERDAPIGDSEKTMIVAAPGIGPDFSTSEKK